VVLPQGTVLAPLPLATSSSGATGSPPAATPEPSGLPTAAATASGAPRPGGGTSPRSDAHAGAAGAEALGGWMKTHMTPALAAKDFTALATLLGEVAAKPAQPVAQFPNWSSIARDGASAARVADYGATKAACRSCHDQYKARYIALVHPRPAH
jgi:hypothetical protein